MSRRIAAATSWVPASAGEDLRAALPGWVVARVLVLAAFAMAVAVSDDLLAGGRPPELDAGLLSWDGGWYSSIAEDGYEALAEEALRFYPLYPLAGRWLGFLLLGRIDVALVVIANGLALVVGALMHRLALVETGDEALARRAAWYTALLPASFVLVFAYSEALMLTATVGAFLALRRGRWWWAAGLGVIAGFSRPLGVFLALPAAIEALRGWRTVGRRELVARAAAVVGPGVGTLAYLAWSRAVFDDALLPLTIQRDFRGDFVNPVARLAEGVGELFGPETFGDGLHLPFALAYLALLVVTIRRWPASYSAYAAVIVAVSLSADNLNSLERYGLNAFPLVLALATVTGTPERNGVVTAACGGGLVALTGLALLGQYVP